MKFLTDDGQAFDTMEEAKAWETVLEATAERGVEIGEYLDHLGAHGGYRTRLQRALEGYEQWRMMERVQ